ncbi:branched-chain amino acid ABC transporter substrate-binding protein [Labrys sp. LIt4]|uniref:Branched chain amino acid ABC transporter substrate-binding protein n=1 Tax=Labrys okinawensis TaxID=346911 RepID=A0A2S9QB01_9HYPH|nr:MULTISPECIES: branched-chain amino acid ABC transporter substrate-binding protein [Labrys]MBP0578775.1 branched-chain amino acid ABC transporter substrate-binding protein [Labrys sp. LIt4]PRH86505.1 branched chain amino acid ABC transporter substrate-binding protein [Labrys okinawensis]
MNKLSLAGAVLAAGLALGGSAQAQIKLGVGGPMTGPAASYGLQAKAGAEMAVKDINAKGGVLGQKIEISVGDDQADPKQSVSVANKFVGDGVTWVVGHVTSGGAIAASDVYADNNIINVTPSASSEKLTDRGLWNTFRTCGRDDQQSKVWADYVLAHFKDKKIAIAHDKQTYGEGLAKGAKKYLNDAGVKEVLYEGANAGEKDYSGLVTKLKSSGADVLLWGGYYTEGALILKQLRDQGGKTIMMGADGLNSPEFATIGGDAVVSTLMTFAPKVEDIPANADLVKRFREGGTDPAGFTLLAYAGVQVLAQAAEEAKSTDPQKIAEVMHSGKKFQTVIGEISYDKKGDLAQPAYAIYTWKKAADGKIAAEQNPS